MTSYPSVTPSRRACSATAQDSRVRPPPLSPAGVSLSSRMKFVAAARTTRTTILSSSTPGPVTLPAWCARSPTATPSLLSPLDLPRRLPGPRAESLGAVGGGVGPLIPVTIVTWGSCVGICTPMVRLRNPALGLRGPPSTAAPPALPRALPHRTSPRPLRRRTGLRPLRLLRGRHLLQSLHRRSRLFLRVLPGVGLRPELSGRPGPPPVALVAVVRA